jgi:deoxyribodipyrimidine photolyase-related protein
VADTEHFLTSRRDLAEHFQGKKRYLMESFYRQMRRRHDILIDDGRPTGGKWNYDQSNRQRYDGKVPLPEICVFSNDVSDIVAMLDRCQVPTFGRIDPKRLIWPVSRKQALRQLKAFVDHRLPHFGTYQDAMTAKNGFLFHSLLSFALNTKMLNPMEVIQAAIARFQSTSGAAVGIEQLEGFIRQILGWREYMRGIYWAHMPAYASMNHFGHSAPLPDYYWTGDTRMNCLRSVISQSLEHAYAHHIQRLMITGNFALLAGIHPDEVDQLVPGHLHRCNPMGGDRQYAGNEPVCRWWAGGHQALYLLCQLYPQDERLLRRLSLRLAKTNGGARLPLQQFLLGLYSSPSAVACRQSPCRDDGSDLGSDAAPQAG